MFPINAGAEAQRSEFNRLLLGSFVTHPSRRGLMLAGFLLLDP